MQLKLLESDFSIMKLSPQTFVPNWVYESQFYSISKTNEELSVVCSTEKIVNSYLIGDIEHNWSCIKIEGILDFSLTGILVSIATPLAEAEISIFAVSTFNTDYILIKKEFIKQAMKILINEGHSF